MSMFKRIKSVFIVEDESFVPKNEGSVATKKVATVKTPDIPVNRNASASDKFVDNLLKAIEANNLEGFDYLEYKQSLRSLSSMDMDEATKFNSAFAMAKTKNQGELKSPNTPESLPINPPIRNPLFTNRPSNGKMIAIGIFQKS